MVNADDYYEVVAADLDRYAQVPDDVLMEIVTRDGACMWLRADDEEPEWHDDGTGEREVAARICAGCPVQRECLELELRVAGPATVGVWGGMSEDDRRALLPVWLVRRAGAPGREGEGPS